LPDNEALAILIERRGSMYDPLIVDTFIRVHKALLPSAAEADHPKQALAEITASGLITSCATEPKGCTLNNERLPNRQLGLDLLLTLAELVPFDAAVVFVYDPGTDELYASAAMGDHTISNIEGVRLEPGQRLSGWVAANRRHIVNSDPAIDLNGIVDSASSFKSCLSSPMMFGDVLYGVITLYSARPASYSDIDRLAIDAAVREHSNELLTGYDVIRYSRPSESNRQSHSYTSEFFSGSACRFDAKRIKRAS
jgi:hypothetical protein